MTKIVSILNKGIKKKELSKVVIYKIDCPYPIFSKKNQISFRPGHF